jgi:hypothetical protein
MFYLTWENSKGNRDLKKQIKLYIFAEEMDSPGKV